MTTRRVTYLDNAATSWPKPPEVARAMKRFLDRVGANPGRSGHRLSIEAARVVYQTRETLAELLGLPDPLRVIFCANATHALNLALRGLLRPGDHVIITGMEHNSVVRPLRALEAEGVAVTVVGCAPDGTLDPAAVARAMRQETVLVVMTHASNVVGTILPVADVAALAREHGALLLVDAAQSLGCIPFSMPSLGADLIAFTGHKALYGPMGTGGLVLGERVDPDRIAPLLRGGTGSESDSEFQPQFLPDKFESGTLNVVGLAGLEAAVRWLLDQQQVECLREREKRLTARLIEGLAEVAAVRVQGPLDPHRQAPVVSFTIDGLDPAETGLRLDEEFGIAVRIGLHCSPLAHKTLGTYPAGTVRLSLGAFTTERDIDWALLAVRKLASTAGRDGAGRRTPQRSESRRLDGSASDTTKPAR
jgi:cysteine desulfurase/selenocysteine lyase